MMTGRLKSLSLRVLLLLAFAGLALGTNLEQEPGVRKKSIIHEAPVQPAGSREPLAGQEEYAESALERIERLAAETSGSTSNTTWSGSNPESALERIARLAAETPGSTAERFGQAAESEAKQEIARAGEAAKAAVSGLQESVRQQREEAAKAYGALKAGIQAQLDGVLEQERQGVEALELEEVRLVAQIEWMRSEASKASKAFAAETARLSAAGAKQEKLDSVRREAEKTFEKWEALRLEAETNKSSIPEQIRKTQEGWQTAAEVVQKQLEEEDQAAQETQTKWQEEEKRMLFELSDLGTQERTLTGQVVRVEKQGWRAWLPWASSSLLSVESSTSKDFPDPLSTKDSEIPTSSVLAGNLQAAWTRAEKAANSDSPNADMLVRRLADAQAKAEKAKGLVKRAKGVFDAELLKVEQATMQYLGNLRSANGLLDMTLTSAQAQSTMEAVAAPSAPIGSAMDKPGSLQEEAAYYEPNEGGLQTSPSSSAFEKALLPAMGLKPDTQKEDAAGPKMPASVL